MASLLQVEKMSLHPVTIDTDCSFLLRKIGGSLKTNYALNFPAQWAVLCKERTCLRNQSHIEIKKDLQLCIPLRETDRTKQNYAVSQVYTDNRGTSFLPSLPFEYILCKNWKNLIPWSRGPDIISNQMRIGKYESKLCRSETTSSYKTLHKLEAIDWDLN